MSKSRILRVAELRKYAIGLVAGLCCLAAGIARAADPDLPKTPIVKELAPGVFQYINANGLWNSGFVIGKDSVAVIDAMLTPADARKVLAEIKKRTDRPIRYLIITHGHSDHYFGAQVYVPPAELIAHESVRDYYANHLAEEFKFRKTVSPKVDLSEVKVVLPTLTIDGTGKVMTLHLGGKDVEIYYFGPGQTPDALFTYVPADKIMFTGDAFNRKSINYMANAVTLKGWFDILDKIEAMDVKLYAGGHGLPATKEDFRAYRQMMTDFIDGVKQAMAKGLTAERAAAEITLPQYKNWRNSENFTKRNVVGLYERFQKEKPEMH